MLNDPGLRLPGILLWTLQALFHDFICSSAAAEHRMWFFFFSLPPKNPLVLSTGGNLDQDQAGMDV